MITIRGIEIDFDITAPTDILKLQEAKAAAAERDKNMPSPPETLGDDATEAEQDIYLGKYAGWLNANLNSYGNFIDDLLGDGVAEMLLTKKPSFTRIFEVNEDLKAALGVHVDSTVSMFENSMKKYEPNRATRRTKKK